MTSRSKKLAHALRIIIIIITFSLLSKESALHCRYNLNPGLWSAVKKFKCNCSLFPSVCECVPIVVILWAVRKKRNSHRVQPPQHRKQQFYQKALFSGHHITGSCTPLPLCVYIPHCPLFDTILFRILFIATALLPFNQKHWLCCAIFGQINFYNALNIFAKNTKKSLICDKIWRG